MKTKQIPLPMRHAIEGDSVLEALTIIISGRKTICFHLSQSILNLKPTIGYEL